jgi:hypothetical protein
MAGKQLCRPCEASWAEAMVTAANTSSICCDCKSACQSNHGIRRSLQQASHNTCAHICRHAILGVTDVQAAKQQHRPVRLILEGWVDELLTNSANQQQSSLHHQQQPPSPSTGALRGAAAAGLSRQQLLAAGLSSGAVEQLYRCLYVYTMGFVDTIKVCRTEDLRAY